MYAAIGFLSSSLSVGLSLSILSVSQPSLFLFSPFLLFSPLLCSLSVFFSPSSWFVSSMVNP